MFYCPGCQGGLGPTDDGRPQAPLGSNRRCGALTPLVLKAPVQSCRQRGSTVVGTAPAERSTSMASRLNPYISFKDNARAGDGVLPGGLRRRARAQHLRRVRRRRPRRRQGHARASSRRRAASRSWRSDTPAGMDRTAGHQHHDQPQRRRRRRAARLLGQALRGRHGHACRSRSRCGATSSACAPTSSASAGWSTSPGSTSGDAPTG